MERYTPTERGIIVSIYLRNNSSVVLAQREFRRQFPRRLAPSPSTFRRLAARLEDTGSTRDRTSPGGPRTIRSNENIQAVRDSVHEEPSTSTRKRATQLGISRRSLQRILVKDLKMYPYKIQMVHQLLPIDHQSRLTFSQRLLQLSNEIPDFYAKLLMSDEAHFHLSGHVNKQNSRFWATENPQILHETPLHPQKVTVWCAVCSLTVIGPYFFEDEDGDTVTVNGERYRHMLEDFLAPNLVHLGLDNMWFQQDGATAHTAGATIQILKDLFPTHLISRSGDIAWPARSPDLTVPDFFLWGYLKDRVYVNKPQTIQALKDNIRQEIADLEPEMLENVMQNVQKRAQSCIAVNGGHLTDIIFET